MSEPARYEKRLWVLLDAPETIMRDRRDVLPQMFRTKRQAAAWNNFWSPAKHRKPIRVRVVVEEIVK